MSDKDWEEMRCQNLSDKKQNFFILFRMPPKIKSLPDDIDQLNSQQI